MSSPSGGSQYQQDVGAPGGPHGPKITSIFDFTEEALEQFAFWLEQRGLHIPFSLILGAQQFSAQPAATILTNETRTSSTYGDLATVGPTLAGLPDGKYLLLYGCVAKGVAGSTSAVMSVQVNATTAVDNDAAQNAGSDQVSVTTATTKSLSNGGNNTITAKYRSTDNVNTSSFARRWLIALRYANP